MSSRREQEKELLEALKSEGQKDAWIEMLSAALCRVVIAVTDNDAWEGSVADGLDAINARFQQTNAELTRLHEENDLLKTKLSAVTRIEQEGKELDHAAEMLWVVVANVSGGDWPQQSPEWQEAAARWRDNYFFVRDKWAEALQQVTRV